MKKKHPIRRALGVLLCLCLLGGALVLGLNGYVRHVGGEAILTGQEAAELKDIDAIVVLGCQVRPDGTPSLMLQDRIDKSVELYKAGAASTILMSGDHHTQDYDEPGKMKEVAVGQGVEARDVFQDHGGLSTYETMYRAKEVFGAQRVLIVTQRYHLYRSLYIAQALGLEAWGVPALEVNYPGQTYRDVREILARCKDVVKSISQPLPTYLGKAVDLDGDGGVTDDWPGAQLLGQE